MSMKPILLDETGLKMVEALNRIADKSGEGGSIELAPNLSGNEANKSPSVKAVNEGLALKAEKTDVETLKKADDALDVRVKDLEFFNGMAYTTQTESFSAVPIPVPEGALSYAMLRKISDIQVGASTMNGRVKNHEIYDQWGATFTVSEEKDSSYTAIHISAPEGSDEIWFEFGFDAKSVSAGERVFVSVWIDKNSVSIPEFDSNGSGIYVGNSRTTVDFDPIDVFAGQRLTYMYTPETDMNIDQILMMLYPSDRKAAVDFTVKVGISKQLGSGSIGYNFDPTPAFAFGVNEDGSTTNAFDELASVTDLDGAGIGSIYDYNNKSMIYNYQDYDTSEYVCRLVRDGKEAFLLDEEKRIPFKEYKDDGMPYRELRLHGIPFAFGPLDCMINPLVRTRVMKFPIDFEWTYVKERGV